MIVLALALTVAVLYAAGTYLLFQRNLSRIIIGLALLTHGANLLLLLAAAGCPRSPAPRAGRRQIPSCRHWS